jgi:hypothetical protein
MTDTPTRDVDVLIALVDPRGQGDTITSYLDARRLT